MKHAHAALLAACLTLSMAGCSTPAVHHAMSPVEAMQALGNDVWTLQHATDATGNTIQALFVRPDKPLELHFNGERIHVANACNILNGNVKIANGTLSVPVMISTMMACANPAVSALDRAVSTRLQQPATFRIDTHVTPPTLTLVTANKDRLVFTGTPASSD